MSDDLTTVVNLDCARMTVRDLIAALRLVPPACPVYVLDPTTGAAKPLERVMRSAVPAAPVVVLR